MQAYGENLGLYDKLARVTSIPKIRGLLTGIMSL
jgi:hypothetical protein